MSLELQTKLYSLNPDTTAASFQLNVETKAKDGSANASMEAKRWLIVVLDNSGSMSGSPLTAAKASVIHLVTNLLESDPNLTVSVIEFNSYASVIVEKTNLLSAITARVKDIRATGGTSFANAFSTTTQLISKYRYTGEKENVFIVFFTDGCDGSTAEGRKAEMQNLKKTLEVDTSGAALHTIGFSSSHDARLLGEITTGGTTQGTFQYVADTSQINAAMDTLISLLGSSAASVVSNVTITEKSGKELLTKKVFFNAGAPGYYTATTFLPTALLNAADTQITLGTSIGKVSQNFGFSGNFTREELEINKAIELSSTFITDSLIEMSAALFGQTKATADELIKAKDKVKELELQMQRVREQIMKMKGRNQRKQLMPLTEEVGGHLAEFHSALASAMAGSLTNETIAQLNSLAYKKVTKRALAKRLDQRVEENAALFQKLDGMLEKASNDLNESELKSKYGESVDAFGQCMLSCKNWLDAILDADCMCIAINVTRSEAAIADPTQVVVHSISPSFLTADSFLDSVEFALTKSEQSQEAAHGGFDKRAAPSVVVGTAREAISAVLPLYINDDHWSIAKHKMKPVMGWVTTLDVLGYTSGQIRAIPFLAMATAAREAFGDKSSAFKVEQYNMIFQTCKQIVKDFSQPTNTENNLANELKGLFEKYNADPSVRTVDVIPNNWIFLMQLHCAIDLKLIDPLSEVEAQKFVLAFAEEELRRRPPPLIFNSTDVITLVRDTFGISETISVYPIVEKFKNDTEAQQAERITRLKEFYGKKIQDLEDGLPSVFEEGKDTIADCLAAKFDARDEVKKLDEALNVKPFEGKIEELNEAATNLISDYEKAFKFGNISSLVDLTRLFFGLPRNQNTGFDALGNFDQNVLLALCVQCALQNKNADRREAVEKGLYKNPFTNANEILAWQQTSIVQELKEKRVREIISNMDSELQYCVSGFQQQFLAFFAGIAARWNSECIRLYWKLNPLKALVHAESKCNVCSHSKPTHAGFRCVCGCMDCFTSYYYNVKPVDPLENMF